MCTSHIVTLTGVAATLMLYIATPWQHLALKHWSMIKISLWGWNFELFQPMANNIKNILISCIQPPHLSNCVCSRMCRPYHLARRRPTTQSRTLYIGPLWLCTAVQIVATANKMVGSSLWPVAQWHLAHYGHTPFQMEFKPPHSVSPICMVIMAKCLYSPATCRTHHVTCFQPSLYLCAVNATLIQSVSQPSEHCWSYQCLCMCTVSSISLW